MKIFLTILQIFILCISLPVFFSCSSIAPEDKLLPYIEEVIETATKKNARGLRKFISPDYADKQGRSQDDLIRIAAGYFFRSPSIHIRYRTAPPQFSDDYRHVELTIITAHSTNAIKNDFDLTKAYFHRFQIQLQHESEWLLTHLEWHNASLDEYLDLPSL